MCGAVALGLCYKKVSKKYQKAKDKLHALYAIGYVKFRTLFFAAQVISQFVSISSDTGKATYPQPSAAFAGALGVTNLDVISILSADCFFPGADFYDKLM